MTLREKRILFSNLIAQQLLDMNVFPHSACFDQVKRTQAEANANATAGTGIKNSLHLEGLAADINLYFNGAYMDSSDAHKPFGEMWKARHPMCKWGGDIKGGRPDGNHYSFSEDNRI